MSGFLRSGLISTLLLLLIAADAADAAVRLDGDLVQGGLLLGYAPAGSQARLDGEALMISPEGEFLIGFGRDETQTRYLEVQLPSGEQWSTRLTPEPRSFDIQRIDGLPSEQVTPLPEVLQRIRDEAAMARRARERRDARTDWTNGFIWPAEGRITGVYGSQRILNGQARAPHWGIDIAAPTGTPVQAPAGGLITLTHPDMYFSGGTVFLDHGHGLVSAFLHLDEILVESGQRVEQGELIGLIGATGRATGPHLDWRISLGDTRVDPMLLLPPRPE
ncbi:MAG: M23 family metallopeptidase [Wenzhouxiangella sp.]